MKHFKRIIALLAISLVALAFMTSCANPDIEKIPPEEMPEKAVMVDDMLYYYTSQHIELLRCGVMDGKIKYSVPVTQLPAENDTSNFGTGYEYQYVDDNHIDIIMPEEDNAWVRFCNENCDDDHSQTLTEALYTEWVGDFEPDYDTEYYDSTHYSGIPETVNPGGPDIPAHLPECPYDKCITEEGADCIRVDGCICGYPLEEDIKTFPGHIRIVE